MPPLFLRCSSSPSRSRCPPSPISAHTLRSTQLTPRSRRSPAPCLSPHSSRSSRCSRALLRRSPSRPTPLQLAAEYAKAIETLNRAHADKPTATSEADLSRNLPPSATKALNALLAQEATQPLADALVTAADAALELDLIADFESIRTRLESISKSKAAELGIALSRPRFLARGLNGIEPDGLRALADVFDRVLDGYEELFGLTNFSKVPGKKLRLRAHLEPTITHPPHFAPQFPFHSEIDFPLVDARAFTSPTADGKFLLYGLCHELGHVVAMWGDPQTEEDHHSWAHYAGLALVEHLSHTHADDPALKSSRDVRWRSLELARAESAQKKITPGTQDAERVLALLIQLHDTLGPKALGTALNALDAVDKNQRVNRVRYYRLADFEKALLTTKEGQKQAKNVRAAFEGR